MTYFWHFRGVFAPKIDLAVVIPVHFGRELVQTLGGRLNSITPSGLSISRPPWGSALGFSFRAFARKSVCKVLSDHCGPPEGVISDDLSVVVDPI